MPDENITPQYDTFNTESTEDVTQYIIQEHNNDIIFSKESLEEFIRLIQRQGINNLTIYSVSDLLAGNPPKYQTIHAKFPPPNFPPNKIPLEFELKELKDKKGYFVFVRYSFCWEGAQDGVDVTIPENGAGKNGYYDNNHEFHEDQTKSYYSLNELNGRHVFVKTVNDIHFYEGYDNDNILNQKNISLFHEQISDQIPVPNIVGDNANYIKDGTFTLTIDNVQDVIKIKGFNDNGEYVGIVKRDTDDLTPEQIAATQGQFLRGDGIWTNTLSGNYNVNSILPNTKNTYDIGAADKKWNHIYANNANVTNILATTITASGTIYGTATTAQYAIIAGKVGDTTVGDSYTPIHLDNGVATTCTHPKQGNWFQGLPYVASDGVMEIGRYIDFHSSSSTWADFDCRLCIDDKDRLSSNYPITAPQVFNAVFNDYAECRTTIDLEPGRVVYDNDDGSLSCAERRLIPGAQIISDTYGSLMGETDNAKTPIAVAGRVLVYPYQDKYNYHAGMAVCSAPNGTVDIMTRKEIKDYPDCIIGIVSEIPEYEEWGTNKIKVNNRIWIKVK